MSAAIVESGGAVRQLDARAGEPINVTADDVKNQTRHCAVKALLSVTRRTFVM